MDQIYLLKDKQYLYQILDVINITTSVTYPYCNICFKRVTTSSSGKKWYCTSCNEEFIQINYRYRLSLEASNLDSFKTITIFGNKLEAIFGSTARLFYNYINEIKKNLNETDLLKLAYNYCLIGKWVVFEFEANPCIVKSFTILDSDYVSVYQFLRNQSETNLCLDFSQTSELIESVIDDTINEEDEEKNDKLDSLVNKLKIESKAVVQTTPLFKRLNRKRIK